MVVLRAMEQGRPAAGHRAAGRDLQPGQGRRRAAGARDLRAGRGGVHDRLTPAAGRGAVRQARPVAQAPRQDRLLHRRARAGGDPRRARDRGQGRALARADQAGADLPRRLPPAAGRRRAPAHHLQPGDGRHRASFLDQPQPAEHPHPHRAGARDPRLLRGRARQPAAVLRLLAGRAAGAGPGGRRAGAQGDLPRRRGRAHRDRDAGVQRRRGRHRPRHALQVQDDQLRDRLRAVGIRPGRSPADPARGGRRVHRRLPGALPAGARVHRFHDRAGHRGRVRDHAVRPPPADSRAALGPLHDALAGRAPGGQHGDPGHRRRHHQGGDGALPPGAGRRRPAGRA